MTAVATSSRPARTRRECIAGEPYQGVTPFWAGPVTTGRVLAAIVRFAEVLPLSWAGEWVWRAQKAVDRADRVLWRRRAREGWPWVA